MSNSEPLKPYSQPNLREVLDDGIIHFDATGARREAMRRAAANRIEGSSHNGSKNGSAHVVSNSNGHRNGNGQLHAAVAPTATQPVAQPAPLSRIAPESTISAPGPKNQSGVASWKERVQSAIGISTQPAHTPKSSPQPTLTQSAPAASPAPAVSPTPVAPTISAPPKTTTLSNTIQSESTPSASIGVAHNGSQLSRDQIRHFLVDFVMEQTGYPEDIVSVDADLEADLGIDSIKIAQMIGEVIEHFGLDAKALQRTSADNYKTLNTIIDTIASLGGTNVDGSSAAQPLTATSPTKQPLAVAPAASHIAEEPCAPELAGSDERRQVMTKFLIDFVIEQTGYPEDIVLLDSDLEADLGIDSIKIAQMMGEMNDHFGLTIKDYDGRTMDDFKSLGAIISHLTK
ncbi:MAG: phosphopantetheine-binding protein [Pirellula sp.]|jgi:acyl carrier protein